MAATLWSALFYLFLILVFLVFIRLSYVRFNGRRVMKFPMCVAISLVFPLVFILVALFSSIFLLFMMSLVLIALLVFLLLFFLGRVELWYFGPRKRKRKPKKPDEVQTVIIHSVKKAETKKFRRRK